MKQRFTVNSVFIVGRHVTIELWAHCLKVRCQGNFFASNFELPTPDPQYSPWQRWVPWKISKNCSSDFLRTNFSWKQYNRHYFMMSGFELSKFTTSGLNSCFWWDWSSYLVIPFKWGPGKLSVNATSPDGHWLASWESYWIPCSHSLPW